MPRVLPKRPPTYPAPAERPLLPEPLFAVAPDDALRVLRTFTCEGYLFKEGALVAQDSDLVQRILREYPGRVSMYNQSERGE